MANENEKAILEAIAFDEDTFNLEDLEHGLEEQLEEKLGDLDFLEE